MKVCEHLLPCGYCNKYDVPCKATAERIINYNYLIGEIDKETAEEMEANNKCEHEWENFHIIDKGGFEHREECRCTKCGAVKT